MRAWPEKTINKTNKKKTKHNISVTVLSESTYSFGSKYEHTEILHTTRSGYKRDVYLLF